MSHEQRNSREAKKKPAMTAKEKKAAKHARQEVKAILGSAVTK